MGYARYSMNISGMQDNGMVFLIKSPKNHALASRYGEICDGIIVGLRGESRQNHWLVPRSVHDSLGISRRLRWAGPGMTSAKIQEITPHA